MYQRIIKFIIVCTLCAFSGVGVAAQGDPFFSQDPAYAEKQPDNVLAPLEMAFFTIQYANAEALKVLLESQGNSFLGPRGKISVDKRTNILLVQDTPQQLAQIKKLLAHLDIPVMQVLIEARIVVMDQRAKEELGATLKKLSIGNHAISSDDAGFNWNIAALPSHFALDLELRAMESEGDSKVISSPHLTVANNQAAMIQQGQEIPYQTQTPTGATQIEYKQAVLGLTVTPQITPNGKILMQLQISDDHVSSDKSTVTNVPLVDTSRMSTQVLVDNNQTLMLGGIVKETHDNSTRKTPFLGDIPGLGFFFRNSSNENNRTELVIFVTPKILEQQAT